MSNVCDACGWAAAFGGMLAFGTFGAPIKSDVARSVDIDPLVFQSYKTTMCFLTSWLILLTGEEFTFTKWGIVSGLFWVPGGIGTIYAVKNAGLAIGIGVGSSFIVLVSFTWGIFIFDEHVHSKPGACFAVGCMMMGLLGMAYFSAPTVSNTESDYQGLHRDESVIVDDESDYALDPTLQMEWPNFLQGSQDQEDVAEAVVVPSKNDKEESKGETSRRESSVDAEEANHINNNISNDILSVDATTVGEIDIIDETSLPSQQQQQQQQPDEMIVVCGMRWQRRTLGILSAIFSGSYGGSIMVPMKWAPDDAKGLGYLISFAIGAATINICAWIIRYLYLCQQHAFSPQKAYDALPKFHLRKMWLLGGTSGLLWSIGNFFSILSVEYLGEGVGYSVVQAAMLVSGLWGIFYFHEIRGAVTIAKWFCSALLTVLGILLLSYEHHEK